MISYRPSQGNDVDRVGVTSEGAFFGKSIGGQVLLSLRTNDKPKATYYRRWYSDLSDDSSFFFKSLSDIDFIRGTTVYRAIYIGASERHNDNEILGTITTSVDHDSGNNNIDNTVITSLWLEGIFSETPSQNTILLDDEFDSTNLLSSVSWSNTITVNDVLAPGMFAKIWIKIEVPENPSIASLSGFNYIYNIGDLSIKVSKDNGRISFSRLFKTKLKSDRLVLKETLPTGFGNENFDGIFKIIRRNDLLNIFYFSSPENTPTQPELKLLVIKTGDNLGENKFINVGLSNIFSNSEKLEKEKFLDYIKAFECKDSLFIEATDEFGDKNQAFITGAIRRYLENSERTSGIADQVILDRKFILDIFISDKEDINYIYVYYAQITSDLSDREILNVRHDQLSWTTKVMTIDLNHLSDGMFDITDFGFDNSRNTIVSYFDEKILRRYFYPSSIIKQNDLFTLAGYDIEDCYIQNNRAKLLYLWEKDLINKKVQVQEFNLPDNSFSNERSVFNVIQNASEIKFDMLNNVHTSTLSKRNIGNLDITSDLKFIDMSSPQNRTVKHGFSSVSYDLENTREKDVMSSWAFKIDSNSISTLSETTNSKVISYDENNPQHTNILISEDHDYFKDNNRTISYKERVFNKNPVNIFSLHCANDVYASALDCYYNFETENFTLDYMDKDCNPVSVNIPKENFLLDSLNTISLNTFTHEVKGGTESYFSGTGFRISNNCHMKHIINFTVYVNGVKLFESAACVLNHIDTYVVSHNPRNHFEGEISYFEVRRTPENDIESYALSLHRVHSNIVWAKLGNENQIKSFDNRLNRFNFRRGITLENLEPFEDTMIIPLVFYGASYNIETFNNQVINNNVRRSYFDFSRLSLSKNNFNIFIDKTFEEVPWQAEKYDLANDLFVVWVKLQNWNGQRLLILYNDGVNEQPPTQNPYTKDFFGVWRMNSFYQKPITRFDAHKIFNSSETIVVTKKDDEINITQIDRTYNFSEQPVYKSNKFDIEYDDRDVERLEKPNVDKFIEETAKLFKPATMEIRDIKSKFDYKVESNTSGDKDEQ